MSRQYTRELNLEFHLHGFEIMTVDEWAKLKNVVYGNYDGSGYWVKDGMESQDEVFSTPQEDATHVAWYNK